MNKNPSSANKFPRGILVLGLGIGLLLANASASAQGYWERQEPRYGREYPTPMRFDLEFSMAEGGYINYRCDANYCDSALVAPFDFEFLFGYRITRFLALDLALNFSFDYYGYHYYDGPSEVFVWTSLRPGVRFILPSFYHEQIYFRAAVPLTFRVNRENEEDRIFLPGFLFGFGIEWVFHHFGLFLEVDFLPYFVEIYPRAFIFPVEGRLGIAAHF